MDCKRDLSASFSLQNAKSSHLLINASVVAGERCKQALFFETFAQSRAQSLFCISVGHEDLMDGGRLRRPRRRRRSRHEVFGGGQRLQGRRSHHKVACS